MMNAGGATGVLEAQPCKIMIILGLDPGLANTGFGAIACNCRNPLPLRCGHIRTSAKTHISQRLAQIHDDLEELIRSLRPDFMAIENVYSLVRYPRAGILLGTVLGTIYLSAYQNGIPVVEITPKAVKNALAGYGNADKKQIRDAVQRLLGMQAVTSFHAADALAVALTAYYRQSFPVTP